MGAHEPPQSRSVSVPFITVSVHEGTAHVLVVVPLQTLLVQSVAAAHFFPLAHAGQVPPQFRSVSVPFWIASVHDGAAHVPSAPQTPLVQSAATPHALPSAHLGQLPPQFRSVSVPLRTASVQEGTAQVLAVVPLHNLWVDANFKENQLRHIRIGQPATISTDLYGHKVEYHGKVVGLGAGTGSVFSLLPAQNATGNWIKVVQRVPVRIALDDKELDKHPLRVGLSADVTVDIRHDQGKVLAAGPALPAAETTVYDRVASQADAEADKVIRANLGDADTSR